MQASKKHSFLRRSPLAYVVVPLAFVLVSTALVFIVGHTVLAPYQALLGWFFSTTEVAQPRDLLDNAAAVINGGTVDEPDAQPDRLPLSSVTYPSEGDRYATITISGTNVDAPVYYGDTNKILNAGVGTYKDDSRVGIPGEGKTILLAGHNNTFFNDLQHAEAGATVTITTHYGVYTYEVTGTEILDYQDETAYDFTRTDENLILYTCYPFRCARLHAEPFLRLCQIRVRPRAGRQQLRGCMYGTKTKLRHPRPQGRALCGPTGFKVWLSSLLLALLALCLVLMTTICSASYMRSRSTAVISVRLPTAICMTTSSATAHRPASPPT